MVDGLAMRTNRRNILWPQPRLFDDCESRAGKMFSQQEIKFANFRHLAVQADVQDVSTHLSRESLLPMRHQARFQPPPAAGDFNDDGVNAVRRGARHKT